MRASSWPSEGPMNQSAGPGLVSSEWRVILHGLSWWGGIGERVPHRRAPGAHGQTGGDCAPPVPVLLSVGERYPVRARASTTTSQFASYVAASKPKSPRRSGSKPSRSLRRWVFSSAAARPWRREGLRLCDLRFLVGRQHRALFDVVGGGFFDRSNILYMRRVQRHDLFRRPGAVGAEQRTTGARVVSDRRLDEGQADAALGEFVGVAPDFAFGVAQEARPRRAPVARFQVGGRAIGDPPRRV